MNALSLQHHMDMPKFEILSGRMHLFWSREKSDITGHTENRL